MNTEIEKRLSGTPVVPLVQSDDPEVAVRIAEALIKGGLTVVEVVLRTERAMQCITAIRKACPAAIVGAGTVLSEQQALAALNAGAEFLVSPGLEEAVITVAHTHKVPIFPGIATATEAQRAWNLGLRSVKVFPAGIAGGPAMLKALGSVFREMRFMPTGGISAENLTQYLAVPSVFACGGSWLTPADAIASGDYEEITQLAREAVRLTAATRGQ